MSVDLYWLPLGAGGRSVRLNGRVYEACVAALERRRRFDLYHSALIATVEEGAYVIEMAPSPDGRGDTRGVVAEGAVGSRLLRPFRLFRYEVRCWREGEISDAAEAVCSPVRLSHDRQAARRMLELAVEVPTSVWGRDELHCGDMWNSKLARLVADRPSRP